ncbi:hypothetical protein PPL_06148 [Heterostelium album PN500]|uniref:AB hydrolase-1 domain-containing protein n=1 Tax=Heterostelium pallidum (strain ATCC 26659 / Pp 5 / PN500) TaxID=670386 RepID=D3BCC3_HETP5|nr:hypothetical protein PPL_06148 [Heterostelium album PN500]EFA80913.1 hypothetical protein PPL_06148 [Heterostelium album PN500]|eukprot:XP_020433031.1 hypothetical protein PPL_06148 [Heterostelium album PN500]
MLYSIISTVYWGGLIVGAGVVGLLSLVYIGQEKLIYFPDTSHFLNPTDYGFTSDNFEENILTAKDGTKIQTWFFKQPQPKNAPTMLFCHSNAGNLSHRLPNIRHLYDIVRCNVLIISYRGYGKSQGVPTEHGIKLDVDVSMEFLLSDESIDHDRIFVFGRSLGGAVAVDASSRYPAIIKANILENTFLSIPDMVDVVLPQLKVFKLLCKNKWSSFELIRNIKTPTLFLSGKKDELVPSTHMLKLEELADQCRKKMIIYEKGQHMNLMMQPNYYKHIREFLETVFVVEPPPYRYRPITLEVLIDSLQVNSFIDNIVTGTFKVDIDVQH